MLVGLVLGRYGGVGHLHGRKVELRAHFKKATTLTCPFWMKNVSLRNNKIRRAKREEAKLRFWFKLWPFVISGVRDTCLDQTFGLGQEALRKRRLTWKRKYCDDSWRARMNHGETPASIHGHSFFFSGTPAIPFFFLREHRPFLEAQAQHYLSPNYYSNGFSIGFQTLTSVKSQHPFVGEKNLNTHLRILLFWEILSSIMTVPSVVWIGVVIGHDPSSLFTAQQDS